MRHRLARWRRTVQHNCTVNDEFSAANQPQEQHAHARQTAGECGEKASQTTQRYEVADVDVTLKRVVRITLSSDL
jgi:hypothetical protein